MIYLVLPKDTSEYRFTINAELTVADGLIVSPPAHLIGNAC